MVVEKKDIRHKNINISIANLYSDEYKWLDSVDEIEKLTKVERRKLPSRIVSQSFSEQLKA